MRDFTIDAAFNRIDSDNNNSISAQDIIRYLAENKVPNITKLDVS